MSYIKDFQEKHRIGIDNSIGPETMGKMIEVFKIPGEECVSHYIGQLRVETGNFTMGRESLNYTPQGLIKTFYFYKRRPEMAFYHGRTPQHSADQVSIANNVYADINRPYFSRLGNTRPGDGWKNRGVGAIQLTGNENIEAFLKRNNLPANLDRDIIHRDYYWEVAVDYFKHRVKWSNCKVVSDDQIRKVTSKINPALHALDKRTYYTNYYYSMFK